MGFSRYTPVVFRCFSLINEAVAGEVIVLEVLILLTLLSVEGYFPLLLPLYRYCIANKRHLFAKK